MRVLRVEQWAAVLCSVVCWLALGESAPQGAAAASLVENAAVIAKQDAKATLRKGQNVLETLGEGDGAAQLALLKEQATPAQKKLLDALVKQASAVAQCAHGVASTVAKRRSVLATSQGANFGVKAVNAKKNLGESLAVGWRRRRR